MIKWCFCLFACIATNSYAQNQSVEGIVFDKDSKTRLARVHVVNTRTNVSLYNNFKGEFKINASDNDVLIFTREGYLADTVKTIGTNTLIVYLKSSGILLQEVKIEESKLTPEMRLEATKKDYTKIYGSSANPDFLSTGANGGVGLSLDALFNSFSRSGRNAERLKETIEQDYRENVIDYRFNRTLVGNITGLADDKLTEFMARYRPSYYFVSTATEYEFIRHIRSNYKRFLRFHRPRISDMPLNPMVE